MQALNENWGACDIVMILHELHQRGYEQLRLHCGMSPNGMAWRWNIYPKCLMDDAEWERYGECPPFECPHGSAASYREPINLPPKPQPSRGKKDYVVAITAELV